MNAVKTLCALGLALLPLVADAELLPHQSGEVRYLCGGVAQAEQEAMRAAERDHDLLLTFATATGQYLADVLVDISDDRGGPLLSARCDGPMMLVDLPKAGRRRALTPAA